MERIITMDNFRDFAYCNCAICKRPIRGIVISFMGLGNMSRFDEETEEGAFFAEIGILYLVPYQNPWGWMNAQTVALADELIDVLTAEYGEVPVVSIGDSMGGLSALVYTAYAKRTPIACVANCPVCDLPYHYTERPDLPRTLYSAFATYDGTLQMAMQSASPIHLVDRLPTQTDYYIFHCEQDLAVNKQQHSDRFVLKMRQSHKIEYFAVPDRGHCALTREMRQLFYACIIAAFDGKMICDCHIHSRNSHDSNERIANIACKAAEKSIGVIALTDHCDIQYYYERDIAGRISRSLEEARQTAAEFADLKILGGIELGDCIWSQTYTDEILKSHQYDVVIGSVHAVKSLCGGEPYSVLDFGNFSQAELDEYMIQYFKDVLQTMQILPCDVMAHLTCPLRYINGKYGHTIDSRRYESEIIPILEHIIENNIAMEINTSGEALMPCEWILARYKEMGGYLITLGSDAHIAENVGKNMDCAIAMLKKYGFKFYCYYQNRRAIPCLI